MIVDCAVYVDGKRLFSPDSVEETYAATKKVGGFSWITLHEPDADEFSCVAGAFGLHELAAEDAVKAHQRPKVERYGETLFVVLRAAHYIDETETVEFSELHLFVGPDFVVTARHGAGTQIDQVRRRMETEPSMLQLGPVAVLYAVMDQVVDDYRPVLLGLENDIDEIEDQMFNGSMHVTRRAYELTREVIEFQRATKPLISMVGGLISGTGDDRTPPVLTDYLRDVEDHAIRTQEQVISFRELLQNILNVNIAIVGLQQNEEVKAMTEASLSQNDEVKRISAWAAILFAPTLIGTVYGMNFDNMPELHWTWGYPFSVLLMLLVSYLMYLGFRQKGWLS